MRAQILDAAGVDCDAGSHHCVERLLRKGFDSENGVGLTFLTFSHDAYLIPRSPAVP